MNHTRRHFLATSLASLATVGCHAAPPQQGKRYALLPASEAKHITRLCSRDSVPSIDGTWPPTGQDIAKLEANLFQISKLDKTMSLNHSPTLSYRQYVAIVVAGRKLIYVNAFPDSSPDVVPETKDRATKFFDVCDGGPAFWGAIFDPASGLFSQLNFNGFA